MGLTDIEARSLFRKSRDRVRRGLHSLGISYAGVDSEYPDRLLLPDIELAKNHPEGFDRAVQESEEWFCSRN